MLFTDGLYFSIRQKRHCHRQPPEGRFCGKGLSSFFIGPPPRTRFFLVLENAQLAALEGKAKFGFWEKFDDTHTVVRIATSWATRMDEVEALIDLM